MRHNTSRPIMKSWIGGNQLESSEFWLFVVEELIEKSFFCGERYSDDGEGEECLDGGASFWDWDGPFLEDENYGFAFSIPHGSNDFIFCDWS